LAILTEKELWGYSGTQEELRVNTIHYFSLKKAALNAYTYALVFHKSPKETLEKRITP
jgi:hypothetical protein